MIRIDDAIGHVSSFQTKYRDWQSGVSSLSKKPHTLLPSM